MDVVDPGARDFGLAVRTMLQASRGMQAALAGRVGVGDTDLAALDHLVTHPSALGPVELGNLLGIRSASATALVDRLVEAGHVERHPHPRDRRRVVLQPTDSARADVRSALAPLLVRMAEIVEGLDTRERETVLSFLQALTEAMVEFGDDQR